MKRRPHLLTIKGAADRLGLSTRHARRELAGAGITLLQINRRLVVPAAQVDQLAARRKKRRG